MEVKDNSNMEINPQEITERFRNFLKIISYFLFSEKELDDETLSISIEKPESVNYEKLIKMHDQKFGEYIINPNTINLDLKNLSPEKIKVMDFAEFVGKPTHELAKHIVEKYSDKYYITGFEAWEYFSKNPDNCPEKLRNGKWNYLFGLFFCGFVGSWGYPALRWDGSGFVCSVSWIGFNWSSTNCVVLIEKEPKDKKIISKTKYQNPICVSKSGFLNVFLSNLFLQNHLHFLFLLRLDFL